MPRPKPDSVLDEMDGPIHKPHVSGRPDPDLISTSYAERENLNIRMNMRRFTRKTNAFSKKVENHAAAVSLYQYDRNLMRKHGTLKNHAGCGSWSDRPHRHARRRGRPAGPGLRGTPTKDERTVQTAQGGRRQRT